MSQRQSFIIGGLPTNGNGNDSDYGGPGPGQITGSTSRSHFAQSSGRGSSSQTGHSWSPTSLMISWTRWWLKRRRLLTTVIVVCGFFLAYQVVSIYRLIGSMEQSEQSNPSGHRLGRSERQHDSGAQDAERFIPLNLPRQHTATAPKEQESQGQEPPSQPAAQRQETEPPPQITRIPGVLPQFQSLYAKGLKAPDTYQGDPSERVFKCLTSGEIIPLDQVNDDYCDCTDFSDEPSTAACPENRFYCTSQPPSAFKRRDKFAAIIDPQRAVTVAVSRVNDGVCDCCDGSDEWQHLRSPVAELEGAAKWMQAAEHIHQVPCTNWCTY